MKLIKISIFILLVSNHVMAQIPDNMMSAKIFKQEIKLIIQNKITQMEQNFIVDTVGKVSRFTSDKYTDCQTGLKVAPHQPILEVISTEKNYDNINKTVTSYIGCDKNISFKEISTISKTREIYELEGPKGLKFIRIYRQINKDSITSSFYIHDKEFVRITEKDRGLYTDVHYYAYPQNIYFTIFGSTVRLNTSHGPIKYNWARVYKSGLVEYYDGESHPVSLAFFQTQTNLDGLSTITNALLKDLPVTKFLTGGNQNAKLINELRNAQTFLLSNTNIEYVQNLINDYLKAAIDNEITDNRN